MREVSEAAYCASSQQAFPLASQACMRSKCVWECESASVYIWVPLESSGLHAETIRAEMAEKTESDRGRSQRGVRGDSGMFGHMCITIDG